MSQKEPTTQSGVGSPYSYAKPQQSLSFCPRLQNTGLNTKVFPSSDVKGLEGGLAYVSDRVPAVCLRQLPVLGLRLRVLPRQFSALQAASAADGRQRASLLHPEAASAFNLQQAGAADADLSDGCWRWVGGRKYHSMDYLCITCEFSI